MNRRKATVAGAVVGAEVLLSGVARTATTGRAAAGTAPPPAAVDPQDSRCVGTRWRPLRHTEVGVIADLSGSVVTTAFGRATVRSGPGRCRLSVAATTA